MSDSQTYNNKPVLTAAWGEFKPEFKPEFKLDAAGILQQGINALQDRAALRDAADGERSMELMVRIFNAAKGFHLSEADGWLFMECLKIARSEQGGVNADDYIDGAAYAALRGEAVLRG